MDEGMHTYQRCTLTTRKLRQQSFAQSWTQHTQLSKFHFYVLNFTLAKKLHTLAQMYCDKSNLLIYECPHKEIT